MVVLCPSHYMVWSVIGGTVMRMIPETRKLAMKFGFGLVAGLFVLAALSETAGPGAGLGGGHIAVPADNSSGNAVPLPGNDLVLHIPRREC